MGKPGAGTHSVNSASRKWRSAWGDTLGLPSYGAPQYGRVTNCPIRGPRRTCTNQAANTMGSFFGRPRTTLKRRTESRHCETSKISACNFLQPSFFPLTFSLPANPPSPPSPASASHDVLSNGNNRHFNFPIRSEGPPLY